MFPCEMARYIAGFSREARKYGVFGPPGGRQSRRNPANSGAKVGFQGYDTPAPLRGRREGPLPPLPPAVLEPIDPAYDLELILFHRSTQDRGRRTELTDVIDHILPDSVGQGVAGLTRYRLHRRRDAFDQRGQVPGQCGVVLERFDRRTDCATCVVTENKNQRRAKLSNGVFQTGDRFTIGEIARHAANKEIAAAAVEGVFGCDSRIRTAQYGGVGVLASGQRFALMLEIVTQRYALDVTRVSPLQAVERGRGRQHILWLRRRLHLLGTGRARQQKSRGRDRGAQHAAAGRLKPCYRISTAHLTHRKILSPIRASPPSLHPPPP